MARLRPSRAPGLQAPLLLPRPYFRKSACGGGNSGSGGWASQAPGVPRRQPPGLMALKPFWIAVSPGTAERCWRPPTGGRIQAWLPEGSQGPALGKEMESGAGKRDIPRGAVVRNGFGIPCRKGQPFPSPSQASEAFRGDRRPLPKLPPGPLGPGENSRRVPLRAGTTFTRL